MSQKCPHGHMFEQGRCVLTRGRAHSRMLREILHVKPHLAKLTRRRSNWIGDRDMKRIMYEVGTYAKCKSGTLDLIATILKPVADIFVETWKHVGKVEAAVEAAVGRSRDIHRQIEVTIDKGTKPHVRLRMKTRLPSKATTALRIVVEYMLAEIFSLAESTIRETGRAMLSPEVIVYSMNRDREIKKFLPPRMVLNDVSPFHPPPPWMLDIEKEATQSKSPTMIKSPTMTPSKSPTMTQTTTFLLSPSSSTKRSKNEHR